MTVIIRPKADKLIVKDICTSWDCTPVADTREETSLNLDPQDKKFSLVVNELCVLKREGGGGFDRAECLCREQTAASSHVMTGLITGGI